MNIFEVRQMATAQVTPMEHLSASFRIRGLPWGQEPPDGGDAGFSLGVRGPFRAVLPGFWWVLGRFLMILRGFRWVSAEI